MAYADANVFITAVLYDNEKAAKAKKFLTKIASGEVAHTSILTWDELVWIVRKNLGREDSVTEGRKFMEFPNLRFIPAGQIVMNEAQRLIETYGIKPRDAIHAASAVSEGIKDFISDDEKFDDIKEFKRIPIEKL